VVEGQMQGERSIIYCVRVKEKGVKGNAENCENLCRYVREMGF